MTTDSKQLPLAHDYQERGLPMIPVSGWRVPAHFGDPEAEYHAAREGVALFDASFLTTVRATGSDILDYLNRRLSQFVRELAPGRIVRANQLGGDGRMEADLQLAHVTQGNYLLIAPPAIGGDYLQQLADKYVFTEDAEFTNATGEFALFALFGAKAAEALAQFGAPSISQNEVAEFALEGQEVTAFRCDFLAGAITIAAPASSAAAVRDALLKAVENAGGRQIGFLPFDTIRVESGVPWWGIDLTERSIPLEADLTNAIHTNKGCYPGQETIAKIMNLGHPARKLVGIVWDADDPLPAGISITVDGKEAGTLTSSSYSPALGKAIGLAMVRWNFRNPETTVTAEDTTGKIQNLPLV